MPKAPGAESSVPLESTPEQPAHPRRVLITARLECPVCGHPYYDDGPRSGDGWFTCREGRLADGSRCKAVWWALVLAPNASGANLARIVGDECAAAIVRQVIPAEADLPVESCMLVRLTADARAYVEILGSPRVRHVHRFAQPRQLLEALGVFRRIPVADRAPAKASEDVA